MLSTHDVSSEVQCVSIPAPVTGLSPDSHMTLGSFKMKWKRAESRERIDLADVSVNLPHVLVKTLPYSLTVGKYLHPYIPLNTTLYTSLLILPFMYYPLIIDTLSYIHVYTTIYVHVHTSILV